MSEQTVRFDNSLDSETRSAWDAYWALSVHSAARQSACYGDVECVQNKRVIYVTGRKNGKVEFIGLFGLAPFIWRDTFSEAVCLRGPVFDDVTFGAWCLTEVLRYFSNKKVGQVRIGPRWLFPEAEKVEQMLFDRGFQIFERHNPLGRRSTGIISINADDEKLLGSFSAHTRREVRLANRLGIKVIEATSAEQGEEFFANIKRMYAKKGLGKLTRRDFFPVFDQVLRNGQFGVLLNAYGDFSYLGGLYLTRDGHTVYTYQFVVTEEATKKFRTLRLAPALFFQGMCWGRRHGCSAMDLEGYSADLRDAGQLALVYLYKQGFRPLEVKTLGQYVAVVHPTIQLLATIQQTLKGLIQKPQRVLSRAKTHFKRKRVVG